MGALPGVLEESGKGGPVEGVKSWQEPGESCDPESSEGRRSSLRLNWREWETGTGLEWLKVFALVVIAIGIVWGSWTLRDIYLLARRALGSGSYIY